MFTDEDLKRLEAQAEARRIKYPIEVSGIDFKVDAPVAHEGWWSRSTPIGSFVAVRSCKEGHGDKTLLGMLVGWVPIHSQASYDKETRRLTFQHNGQNPAIYVFDLKQVVLGCESFWGAIKDEAHLREITNDDIQNVWYVKALKALSERKAEGPPEVLAQSDVDRMRSNQDILARVAKELKCAPDDVGREMRKLRDRLGRLEGIMKDWKPEDGT